MTPQQQIDDLRCDLHLSHWLLFLFSLATAGILAWHYTGSVQTARDEMQYKIDDLQSQIIHLQQKMHAPSEIERQLP